MIDIPITVFKAYTYFIKLSLAVNFVLINERQHDPVADDGALEG